LIGSMEAKLIGALLMKGHPLASHALVKLELGTVIAFKGHDPSGGGVIIGVKVFGPRGWPLFVELWERTNEVHAGFDSLVYHGGIRRLRVRGTDHRHGEGLGVDASSPTVQIIDRLVGCFQKSISARACETPYASPRGCS
jgi:hypothetical protein